MKKNITISFAIVSFLLFNSNILNAQSPEQFSLSELDPYVSSYMQPFAKAMAVSMSGGWAHTAKVHSTLGFDVSFSISAANVPTEDRIFSTNDLDMPNYSFSNSTTPTISADGDAMVSDITRNFTTTGAPSLSFPGFKGLNIAYGGMFAIQAGVGLPKGTELIVRFIPDMSNATNNLIPSTVDIALEKTGMWGIGVKHDIKQWIPVVKSVPFLQISGLFSYSKFYTGFSGGDLSITPERLNASSNLPATTWDNQKFDIGMSSFTGSLLVGANLPIFQPFIGLGFNSAKFDGGFLGDYPVITLDIVDITDPFKVNESETDPITIEEKSTDFNFQAGARLKLGFFVLHYQFTSQKYAMHTAGIAVTLR